MARRYARDNKGRFASTGSGATARGGRLKTASGAKRDTQTIKASAGLRSTVAKPKGLKPGAIKPKQSSKPASKPKFEKIPQGAGRRTAALSGGRRLNISTDGKTFSASLIGKDGAPRMERRGLRNVTAAKAWAANPNARGPRLLGGGLKTEASPKATWTRNARPASTIGKPKGLKPGAIQARAAAKPAAKSAGKPAAKRRGQITPDKVLRVSQRINNVTNAASAKTGVKRLNATEVGVRAKAFATRKVGGMSGTVGMNFQQQQAAVRAGLSKPPRYSTQKPNRNKPLRYNSLGQDSARAKAAQAAMTAREKIAQSNAAKPKPQSTAARTGRRGIGPRAVALPPASVPGYVTGKRVAGTIAKPKTTAKPSSTVARTRAQARAVQRFRRNAILDRTRNWNGRNPGLKRSDTGMRQLSLAGPSKTLYSYKRTKLGRKPR